MFDQNPARLEEYSQEKLALMYTAWKGARDIKNAAKPGGGFPPMPKDFLMLASGGFLEDLSLYADALLSAGWMHPQFRMDETA